MRFLLVKGAFDYLVSSGNLGQLLNGSAMKAELVTDDPLTFDWTWDETSLTPATFTGSTAIVLTTHVIGPFQDAVLQQEFYKVTNLSWTNTGAGPETVTGLQFMDKVSPQAGGVLILDDPVVINVGDTIVLNVPVGIGQATQDAEMENLTSI